MKKKILFVTASLALGGAEKCMAEMIRKMDLGKYDVTVLALNYEKNMHVFDERVRIINGYDALEDLNLPMTRFVPRALKKLQLGKLWHKSCFWLQINWGKKHGSQYFWHHLSRYVPAFEEAFDVCIGYGQGIASYFTIDKVSNAHKKILWLNTDLVRAKYDIGYLTRFYEAADRIVAVSRNVERNACRWFPKCVGKTSCFYDILDTETILLQGREPSEYPDDGVLRVLTVGRLCEAKALHLAMDAAAILKKEGIPFRWYIIGEGALRPELEAQRQALGLEDTVLMPGARSNPYPWFANCDVYVQTSVFEGSCTTLSEAQLFYKPIVTTQIEIAFEKIAEGESGLICAMEPAEIARCLKKLLTDADLRQAMAEYQKTHPLTSGDQIRIFDEMIESL